MLKKWLSILGSIFLLTFLSASPALAVEDTTTYQVHRLPEGKIITYKGDKYMGYNLGQFKDLLIMDAEYAALDRSLLLAREHIDHQDEKVTLLEENLEISGEQIGLLKDENARVTKKWKEENRLRHIADHKPLVDIVTLATTIAVVEGIVIILLIALL